VSRPQQLARLAVVVLTLAALITATGTSLAGAAPARTAPARAEVRLPGSVAPFTALARPVGQVAGRTRLTIQVWLRPDLAAAQRYALAVSTPGSRLFHRYLGPAAYTARFGPSRAAAAGVAAWLHRERFTGVRADAGRDYVRATAPVARIAAAFGVRLDYYRPQAGVAAGPYRLRASSRPVTIPAPLARQVLGVTGLDNAAPVLPLAVPDGSSGTAAARAALAAAGRRAPACSGYYGQRRVTVPTPFRSRRSFPLHVCGYTAGQLRAAYGASAALTGRGQTVALVELGLTRDMFLTLRDYARRNQLPAPSRSRYAELPVGRRNACGDAFDVEEQLDVEAAYVMAPGARQLVVGGDSCDTGDFGLQGLFDADLAVLNGRHGRPLASAASNSWEIDHEGGEPAYVIAIAHAYLVRAAAEGVGMYFAAGDSSGVSSPADDPFAVGVGGTSLGIGKDGARLFETGWSTGYYQLNEGQWTFFGEIGAGGGGPSLLWRQPAYQRGAVPRRFDSAGGDRGHQVVRSVPDLSADADPETGMALGLLSFPKGRPPVYAQTAGGGTSEAAPLVAGLVIAAQQGLARPFGFINPALYRLGSRAFHHPRPITARSPLLWRGVICPAALCGAFWFLGFDDQSPLMLGYTGQVTVPGYNNMTGLGTPDGRYFTPALRRLGRSRAG
jgi:subtilase family serine protease